MAEKNERAIKIVAENRKARFNYAIEDTVEAGIALTGTEVKSIRNGKTTIAESYADSKDGEIWLINANIPEYLQANRFNHEPKRPRKLLLHRKQINKLLGAVDRDGMTLIPLKLYFNERGRAKLLLAVAKGRNCTTNARARKSATGAGRRAACCGREDRAKPGLQMNQKNLLEVDWGTIPAPTDDGAAAHLVVMTIPPIGLIATDDTSVTLSALPGRTVVFAYPRTGEPGKIALVDDWDMIPGARGCTPQTCAFRDLFAELKAAGAKHVFGLSTQSNAYQTEMASRLHLPFPVLSDEQLALTRALRLPTMQVAGLTMIKRLALIVDDARITQVFYPVFPPDRNAGDVLAWLKKNPA